jgi:hypothetical protein
MKPIKTKCFFSEDLVCKCKKFAEDSFPTSSDQYSRRNQNILNRDRIILQVTNGKLGEELTYHTYLPYIKDISLPDYNIYEKKDKSWSPDLVSKSLMIKIGVKTKDKKDADAYGPSWIFEKSDKNIFSNNIDRSHYIAMSVVDSRNKIGKLIACVSLQWLHDNNLFTKPDRDYLGTKLTVRLENILKAIKDPDELWQLKCEKK